MVSRLRKQGGFDEKYDVCIVPYDEMGTRAGLFFPQRRLCRQFTIAIAINSRNHWFQFTTAGQFTLLSFFGCALNDDEEGFEWTLFGDRREFFVDSRWGKSSKYCKVLCVNMIFLYAKTLFFSILPIKCVQIYEL